MVEGFVSGVYAIGTLVRPVDARYSIPARAP